MCYAKFCMVLTMIFFVGARTYAEMQTVSNVGDFLKRVEEMAPELQVGRGEISVSDKLVDRAGQFLNPDVNFGSWRGSANNLDWKQTDISILQPIELGGKRSGRIEHARAQANLSRGNFSKSRSDVRASALLTLHRLRQLLYEKTLIEEAQVAFDKLIKSYKRRPQLTPEQSTSLFLFQMAKRDYDLQNTASMNELQSLNMEITRISGLDISQVTPILPKRVESWPKVVESTGVDAPELQIAKARVELSRSELNIAKSESWPTPSVGPSYTDQNQFGEQAKVWGVVVSTKLPLLSSNQGGRAAARETMSLSERTLQIETKRLELEKAHLLASYTATANTLKATNVEDTIHKKHEQIESYFLRGLVNSALVIEAHRQILDSQRAYNSSEIDALDKFYRIRILEGSFLEGNIL